MAISADFLETMLNAKDCDESKLSPWFASRTVLEWEEIGATTVIRYRIQLAKKLLGKDCATPLSQLYGSAAVGLVLRLIGRRFKDASYVSFKVKEDNGFVMSTNLRSVKLLSKEPVAVFGKKTGKGKLQGTFHLEVLFVDAKKIGDAEMCKKYVANINGRFENPSDKTTLKEKVKKAEKWLDMARNKKKGNRLGNGPTYWSSFDGPHLDDVTLLFASGKPTAVQFDHGFALRFHISYPDRTYADPAAIYARFAHAVFNKFCGHEMSLKTHTLFEFQTNDGKIVQTKLRPHGENGETELATDIKERNLGNRTLIGLFTVTIYAVELPDFAFANKALPLLNLVSHSLQNNWLVDDLLRLHSKLPNKKHLLKQKACPPYDLGECTELFEKNCNCEKLHVSDYCSMELLCVKKAPGLVMHRWSIRPSAFAAKLFTTNVNDLNAIFAHRICRNTFSDDFGSGTNLYCELQLNEQVFRTKMANLSDFNFEKVVAEMFPPDLTYECLYSYKEVFVTVYMIDIFEFASNKEVYECIRNFNPQARMSDVFDMGSKDELSKKLMETEFVAGMVKRMVDTGSVSEHCKSCECCPKANAPVVEEVSEEDLCFDMEKALVIPEKGSTKSHAKSCKCCPKSPVAEEVGGTLTMDCGYFKNGSDLAQKASDTPIKIGNIALCSLAAEE